MDFIDLPLPQWVDRLCVRCIAILLGLAVQTVNAQATDVSPSDWSSLTSPTEFDESEFDESADSLLVQYPSWLPQSPSPKPLRPIESPTRWIASADYLALYRSDKLTLFQTDGMGDVHESHLKSEINSGFVATLARQTNNSARRDGTIATVEFLTVSGQDEMDIGHSTYLADTALVSVFADVGKWREQLGGQAVSSIGLRYLGMNDHYDWSDNLGFVYDDLVRTENHLVMLQARIGGDWQWKGWELDAMFSGGIGGNFADQSGLRRDGSSEYGESRFELGLLSEFSANLGRRLTDHLSVHAGFRGLLVDGVLVARRSYLRPGDADEIRYAGGMLGVRYEF
ncbi:hypothetical protein [Rubripirellula reticaptiva]|uniref:Uncharacterized protein n=1 Tax=Rubripirellula reticaptiva TaxID=2528013 RepID=A0A5C6F6H7_9BACT|nr:hypothetical protein [Rubripirellula reticaptiva]TWU55101.1 hypothetical protein Poly59_13970 [Rubripirellula reticaptiva]